MSDVPSDRPRHPEHEPWDDRGDQGDPGDQDMDPGTDAAVRDLLASAGPTTPMPPEVARRLDATLAELGAGPVAGPAADDSAVPGDAGDELGARRSARHRRWPQVLVAAATVGVIGIAVGTAVDVGGSGSGDTSTSAQLEEGAAGGSALDAEREPDGLSAQSRVAVIRLRSDTLAADVQRVEDLALATPVSEGWRGACVVPAAARDASWAEVRLDGARAVLLLRPVEQGRRAADVYRCPSVRSELYSQEQDSPGRRAEEPTPASGRPGPPAASTTVVAR